MSEKKSKDDLIKQGEKIIKQRPKKGRGGTENFPSVIGEGTKADDVRRIGKSLLKWYNMEKAVTDEEIRERLKMYFVTTLSEGEIPTVEEMSLALGYPRQTIWRWESGAEGRTPARRDLIKKAKELLASFDAKMVTEGKINPVTYIFRAKNYFGLKDQQEHILTPNNPLGDHTNPEDIQKRLADGVVDDE